MKNLPSLVDAAATEVKHITLLYYSYETDEVCWHHLSFFYIYSGRAFPIIGKLPNYLF